MTDQQISAAPTVTDPVSAEHEPVIREALDVIDAALSKISQRELMSAGEVADLLLDVRTLLTH